MANIKFGTDGWRAEIAKDFNFQNVALVGAAIADYVRKTEKGFSVRFQEPAPKNATLDWMLVR